MITPSILSDLENLTEREEIYFRIMWAKYGVLYITAKPGVAKSAIARSIAEKMGFRYMDIRLTMVDETDVGLFPSVSESDGVKCLDHVVPRWAIESNKQPTIIHFEELNRASQAVRNAALQILLERQIGIDFKFNDTVLMMSSGNLGDEDNTDVEEFDAALNNRLIHYKHVLTTDEWIKNFAEAHVHPSIVSYIKSYPENLYKFSDSSSAYASPRSWTMLSEFIISNFGKDSSPRDFLPLLRKISSGYVGNSAMRYIQYCEDMLNLNIHDIIDRYDSVKEDLKKYNRDKKSELIQSLKEIDLIKLNENQLNNVTRFLKTIGEDELTAYLLYILDSQEIDATSPKMKKFLVEFKDSLRVLQNINNRAKQPKS